MKRIALFPILSLGFGAFAQGPIPSIPGVLDGNWLDANVPTKRMIPYEHVRAADVLWSKRVWRSIDLREKLNHPLYYPLDEVTSYGWIRNNRVYSLWTIIREHVMAGDLRVFSPYDPLSFGLSEWDGDQLKYPLDPKHGGNFYTDTDFRNEMIYYLGYLGPESDIPIVDENGEPIMDTLPNGDITYRYSPRDTFWYNSEDIVEYRLKEDWFFDKERSKMEVRIIAIAPVVYTYDISPNGDRKISGKHELFWLYFPHCRYIFNNYFTFNERNDAQWMSYDDLFRKRRFNSYIYKESNVYDRSIDTYTNGLDAIRESEEMTDGIRNIEHDLWSY